MMLILSRHFAGGELFHDLTQTVYGRAMALSGGTMACRGGRLFNKPR